MRPGGMPNMQQLMKQAQQMQRKLEAAQAELAELELTGAAGNGLVTVTVTGDGAPKSVKIDPKVVDADDVETLEDLVLAAFTSALDEAAKVRDAKMGPLTGGMGLPF
ncbi:MAG: YbaB/EbfC family nucleoid-associated protein [Hamadaea sp.]|nr:YbaB/EbfC family nucleoid-associated protein [Hamadaea sp.]NUR47579.1 YbaB/EbfC family nucleoid-associated protein [Hamadaea sp.]NUT06652.1 YbaB/EbfC family nucleoid-associated protein [Hamadaea sp.]